MVIIKAILNLSLTTRQCCIFCIKTTRLSAAVMLTIKPMQGLDLIARGLISSAEIRSIIFGFGMETGGEAEMKLTYSSY
jgi:hypothetical protein